MDARDRSYPEYFVQTRSNAMQAKYDVSESDNDALIEHADPFGHVTVRVVFEVCDLCEGRGQNVNPSIDAHGLSHEDFEEDHEFARMYRNGDYDIPCVKCKGKRVTPCLPSAGLTPVEEMVRDDIESRKRARAELEQMENSERMYGA